MIREAIDVEALLIRAYREKAIDRLGHGHDRQWHTLSQLIRGNAPSSGGSSGYVRERVQTSSYGAKLAARETRLWAQLDLEGSSLVALHDAVLGLPTFYYEVLGDLDFQVWDPETALRMGHRITVAEGRATIERMRRRGRSDPKRADELRPAGPVRSLKAIEATTFLICHGRAADRPYVPDVVVTGRRPIYKGASKRAVGHEPVYETPLAEVVEAQAIYATWHACLGMLVAACARLFDLEVTGPLAPAAPWDEAPAIDLGPVAHGRSTTRSSTAAPTSAAGGPRIASYSPSPGRPTGRVELCRDGMSGSLPSLSHVARRNHLGSFQ